MWHAIKKIPWPYLIFPDFSLNFPGLQNSLTILCFPGLQEPCRSAKYKLQVTVSKHPQRLALSWFAVNRHLTVVKICTDPLCPKCRKEETAYHLLGGCSAMMMARYSILGFHPTLEICWDILTIITCSWGLLSKVTCVFKFLWRMWSGFPGIQAKSWKNACLAMLKNSFKKSHIQTTSRI